MAYYSTYEDFYDDHGAWSNERLAYEYKDGKDIHRAQMKVQERSRGKHDPGDGPYTNRIAYGGVAEVTVPGDRRKYILSGERHYEYEPSSGTFVIRDQSWENMTFLVLTVSNNQPRGWGYSFDLKSYVSTGERQRCKIFTFYDYGLTKQEAMTQGRELYNRWKGVPFDRLPYPEYSRSGYLLQNAMLHEEPPRLSMAFFGPAEEAELGYQTKRNDVGLATAFVDAANKLPTSVGINNIANIIDLATSFVSMSKGLQSVGSVADAWLGYRYSYSTTKSDIHALTEFSNRLRELPPELQSNGYYRDGEYEYRVALHMSSPELTSLVSFGEKWGLEMSALNAWDLIPYSFIVDWFIPVSKMLETWQSEKFALKIQQACWCSIRREFTNEFGCKEVDYSRFIYTPNARLRSLSFATYGPKAVTIVKRAVDVLALFS